MQRTRVIGLAAAVLVAAGAVVALQDARDDGPLARQSFSPATTIAPGTVAGGMVESQARTSFNAASGADLGAAAPVAANDAKTAVAPSGPRVVKTATISLSVSKKNAVADVASRVAHLAEAHSGYVASTQTQRGDGASSSVVLRLPAASYDAALAELRQLGKVTGESFGGQDVTGQLVDLDARLRSLRAQEQALNTLLAKANTVGETLQVAQAAGDVRTQIEQLAAQQAQLADQADFATITVQVLGPNAANPDPSPQPLLVKSLKRATAGTLNVLGGMIVVIGYAIPTGLLAAIGYGIWRLVNRRRRGEGSAEPAVA